MRVQLATPQRRAGKLDDATETLARGRCARSRARRRRCRRSAWSTKRSGQHELADLVLHRALDIDEESKARGRRLEQPRPGRAGAAARSRRRSPTSTQASRIDPSLTVARRNKAMVYLDCGDYAKAAEELHAVTHADPSDVAGVERARRGRARPGQLRRRAEGVREGARCRADRAGRRRRALQPRRAAHGLQEGAGEGARAARRVLEGGARRPSAGAPTPRRARASLPNRPPAAPQSKPEAQRIMKRRRRLSSRSCSSQRR